MAKIDDFNKEAKRRNGPLYKVKNKVNEGVTWVKENPKEAVQIFTIVATIGTTVATAAGAGVRLYKNHAEQHRHDYDIYDHSTGMYLHLKRKMNNNDHVILQQYRNQGMSQTEALLKMGLLK